MPPSLHTTHLQPISATLAALTLGWGCAPPATEPTSPPTTVHAGETTRPLSSWKINTQGLSTGNLDCTVPCPDPQPVTLCSHFGTGSTIAILEGTGVFTEMPRDESCLEAANLGGEVRGRDFTATTTTIAVAAGQELPYQGQLYFGKGSYCLSEFRKTGRVMLAAIRFLEDTPWVTNCLGINLSTGSIEPPDPDVPIEIPTDFETLVAESEPIVSSQGASCGLTPEILADLDRRAEAARQCPVVTDPPEQEEEPGDVENNTSTLPTGTDPIEP